MKLKSILYSILAAVIIAGTVAAQTLTPTAFPFVGKWNPSENPLLLENYGLQDIQNLRKDGKHFKGVSGHTAINTSAPSDGTAYNYIANGFHFRKDQPSESHVIIYAADTATPTTGKLFQNTTAIPGAGNFSATVLHAPTAFNDLWRFSAAPAGNMIASNGDETLIWGGNEIEATSFITSASSVLYTVTSANDYSEILSNTRQTADQVATLYNSSSNVLLLHGDGAQGSTTFTDASASAHTVTAIGDAAIDTSWAAFGTGSILMTDGLTTADHADFYYADGPFSFEAVVKLAALPAANQAMIIYSQRTDVSNMAVLTLKNLGGVYSLDLMLKTAGANAYPIKDLVWTTPAINTRYHIAVIRGWGGTANSWTVAVNGVSLGAQTSAATYPDVAAAFQIGAGTTEVISAYPPAHSATYVKATTEYGSGIVAYLVTDPAISLTGDHTGYISASDAEANQRLNIDAGTATVVTRFAYANYHHIGTETDRGAQHFTLWGSNTAASFADTTYATDTGWTQLTTSQATLDQHAASDTADIKYITVTNTTAYRYYSFKFADNYGDVTFVGVRRIELNPVTTIPLSGHVDEIRIVKGAAPWTAAFTPLTQPYGSDSNTFLIGSKRPLQGVKFYVLSGNSTASTLTTKEWQGASWVDLTITDGTAVTGKTMAQTGAASWISSGAAKARYINGLSLYWYQFSFDAGQTTLYYVTVDAPMQTIKNIWDGVEYYPAKCLKYNGTTYIDYTDSVSDGSQSTYADFSSLATTHAVYIGFTEPQQALSFKFVAGSGNTNASVLTSKYWNGSAWEALSAANDGTITSGKTLSKGGVITFQGAAPGTECKKAISDEFPLYYYQLTVGSTLNSDVKVSEITGATSPPTMSSFKFSEVFQNRLFLFNEKSGAKNKAAYSVTNAPDIFNGSDSGEIVFGDKTEITAAGIVYNVFTDSAVEQLLVTKKNETWRLSGDTTSAWTLKKISSSTGCVAPLSMVSCDATDTSPDQKRTVAIWVSDRGPVMSTGSSIIPIYDDIKCYWDPNDSRYIPAAMQSKSVAWYDTSTRSYKLLIASGSTATFLNTELEFSLVSKEWTKLYRESGTAANPLQSGWPVWDTNGVGYTYGGGKDGKVYRLENGSTWAGTSIASYLHTKDLILDDQAPLFRKSTVKYLRTAYKQKAVGNITISHYGDRTATTNGVNGQAGPAVITSAGSNFYNTQSTNLGPFLYHSFKFSASTSVADGLELTGFGIYSAPDNAMR